MALKEMLISEGYSFVSETDSEVIAHLSPTTIRAI